MEQILTEIASAEAKKNTQRLSQLRQALTDLRSISHYAALTEREAQRAVEVLDSALARLVRAPKQKPKTAPELVPKRAPVTCFFDGPQSDLFSDLDRWPRRPYCSDDLAEGVKIRSFIDAITRPYVQANPPHVRVWSLFDIDRPGAAVAWQDAELPPPAWTSVNKQNGHAHSAWGLKAPVLVAGLGARDAPMRFLCGVESMMRERLQADPGFSGLITKNPAHPLWRTLRGPLQFYELSELARHLPGIEKHVPKRGKVDDVGLGRNVTLFDKLRHWAYRAIRKFWGGGLDGWNAWLSECNTRALTMNADLFGNRLLDGREVWHIARSVAKWTWAHTTKEGFSRIQSARGSKGGQMGHRPRTTTAEGLPWVAEGVSRATWYRHRSGLLLPVDKSCG